MHKRHGTHVILKAIAPAPSSVAADQLVYPNLISSRNYFKYTSLLWENSQELLKGWTAFKSSGAREEFQVATLMMAAHRLQSAWLPSSKLFWSAQLTSRSVSLFGRPLTLEVSTLAAHELVNLVSVAEQFPAKQEFFEPMIKAYQSLILKQTSNRPVIDVRYAGVLADVREYFFAHFGEELAYFDRYTADASVAPPELIRAFRAVLSLLTKKDSAWGEWNVDTEESAKVSVDVPRKTIMVGVYRAPIEISRLKGLFAHEVLVHAQRALNGEKIATSLANGLPGYVTAEEGLGVLVESAINGGIPDKVRDRYIDIALALGDTLRRPLSRQELFNYCFVRGVTRSLATGNDINLDSTEREVWEHVNRIYRGSLGNHYIAVFTKDVAYYKGFVKMARYIQEKRKTLSTSDIMGYLLRGKFDPRIRAHRDIIKRLTKA